jgi:hypothetical protein
MDKFQNDEHLEQEFADVWRTLFFAGLANAAVVLSGLDDFEVVTDDDEKLRKHAERAKAIVLAASTIAEFGARTWLGQKKRMAEGHGAKEFL